MSDYSATEQHMRMNYIDEERRRNKFHGESYFQTDEELGEEFDQGMRRIREDAARTVTYTGLKPGVTYYVAALGDEPVELP